MMRATLTFFLVTIFVTSVAHARGDVTKFDGVQQHCAQVGNIKSGERGGWASCRVTKGRWFATLDFIDMYQVQYCLSRSDDGCERRAQLIFSNRAYKPDARLMLQRRDPGEAEYDDPLVVQTRYGDMLALSARMPGGSASKSYYLWRSGRWMPVEAHGWLRDVSRRLPEGVTIKADAWPDIDTMTAHAAVVGADDLVAEIDLGLLNNRFIVKNMTLSKAAKKVNLAQSAE